MPTDLLARIDDRTARVVVVGQGYVGLPVAMRAVEVGVPVTGYELDRERVAALGDGRSYVEDVPDARGRLARERRLPGHRPGRGPRRLRHRGDLGAHAAARRRTRISATSRPRPSTLAARAAAGRARRARVDDVPGHDRGAGAAAARGVRAARGHRLLPRLLARADRPRQPALDVREHPEGRVGDRRRVAARGRGVLRRARRQGRAGGLDRRGRAREAAREHVPPRQHRARQRARDVRRRPRRRHLARDRRRVDQAVRVHALHARPRRRRALPAGRPVVPVVARAPPLGSPVPVRGARQRRQRAHARLRRAAHHRPAQPSRPCRAGDPHPAARRRVQGRDLGLARVAVDRGRRAARRARCRSAGVRPARSRGDPCRPRSAARRRTDPRPCRRPISSSCSSTIPSSTPTRSAGTRRSCSTRRACCAGATSPARSSRPADGRPPGVCAFAREGALAGQGARAGRGRAPARRRGGRPRPRRVLASRPTICCRGRTQLGRGPRGARGADRAASTCATSATSGGRAGSAAGSRSRPGRHPARALAVPGRHRPPRGADAAAPRSGRGSSTRCTTRSRASRRRPAS